MLCFLCWRLVNGEHSSHNEKIERAIPQKDGPKTYRYRQRGELYHK